MKRSYLFLTTALILVLAACGGSNTSQNVPTAQNPTTPTSVIPVTTPTSTGLPDLTNEEPILLTDAVNFTGVQDLFNMIYNPPKVGDPHIKMILTQQTGTEITGTLRMEFEDQSGARTEDWQTFETSSSLATNNLVSIFQDDRIIVYVTGTVSAGIISGTVSYHVRQTNDTECETYTCTGIDETTFNPSYPQCNAAWRNTTCQTFVQTSSNMTTYGTFQNVTLSEWF